MALFTPEEALEYHSKGHKGKVETIPIKPCSTQKHLSMAYTPGVALACKAIEKDESKSFEYTNRGNLVAVVSNGTAVLGLGDIGPAAGKPVMEGKGVLFKIFADIDVYDLNLECKDPDKLIEIVKTMEPTFGGINLEDIKAPECFKVETTLIEQMNIPVFHDDQHGTAIISGAALYSGLEISGKKIEDMKVVVSGAGASATACTNFYVAMGVDPKNVFMFDSRGLLHKGRTDLNEFKKKYAQDKDYGSLGECMKGADLFLGLSKGGVVSKDMVKGMAKHPIIYACANPDPEITYGDAKEARPDCLMATGRSDFPNQINNVLGFPYIFRGALDANSTAITEGMKVAAAKALYALAKEPVPSEMLDAYGLKELSFGLDYIIPKALDTRVIEWESPAVAKAAMDEGVARRTLDLEAYKLELRERLAASRARIKTFVDAYDLGI